MSNIKKTIEELIQISGDSRLLIPLPNDELIEEYQKDLDIKFSEDFKYYLKHANNIIYNLDEVVLVTNRDCNEISELKHVIKEAREVGG